MIKVANIVAILIIPIDHVERGADSATGLDSAAHGRTPAPRPPARAGRQRPVLDRLRERRLVDLLRARPGRELRARPDAGRLHHHRRHLLLTAATYAEATAMYPEAGGSRASPGTRSTSSRPSSPPGRRCSTTRSRSPSRRSSCRTTWAACSGRALRHGPGDIFFGIVVVVVLSGDQRRRGQGVGGRQRRAGGRRLPHPAAAGAGRAGPRLLAADADRQRPSRAWRRRGRTSSSRSRSA